MFAMFIINVHNLLQIYLASAGEMGGMMGKKLGLGISRDLPVMRQKDDMFFIILFFHLIIKI